MSEPTAPPVLPLRPARRQALRHHLLREAQRPARRSRRRLLVLAPAAVLAAAVTAGAIAQAWAPDSAPLVVTVAQGDRGGAALLLDQVAAAAEAGPAPSSGEGGYVYVKSRAAYAELGGGPARLQPMYTREIWIPRYERGDGLVRQPFSTWPFIGPVVSRRTLPDMTPNAEIVDLPSDPDQLLAKLYRERDRRGMGDSGDGAAFTAIGDILRESLMPPRTSAALYRAAAKIPGVEVVRGVTDAVGRPGIAVAHTDLRRRDEWIFDERTLEYLGERSYLVTATEVGPAGTVLGTMAVLQRAVVPQVGQRPRT
ncbi:CU044_5270 family protein [Dactylosporangium sp. NPDC005555]|uniref:CU044_5270 family protein n=1 Tax=Dactylosporangium sp. NPDC005555 TaxID=3154889 RepID=UPI0033BA6758